MVTGIPFSWTYPFWHAVFLMQLPVKFDSGASCILGVYEHVVYSVPSLKHMAILWAKMHHGTVSVYVTPKMHYQQHSSSIMFFCNRATAWDTAMLEINSLRKKGKAREELPSNKHWWMSEPSRVTFSHSGFYYRTVDAHTLNSESISSKTKHRAKLTK